MKANKRGKTVGTKMLAEGYEELKMSPEDIASICPDAMRYQCC